MSPTYSRSHENLGALGFTSGWAGKKLVPNQWQWEQAERVAWRHLVL